MKEIDFWDQPDQWTEGVENILEKTKFFELQKNEFIAQISDNLVRWWLVMMFGKRTRENYEITDSLRGEIGGKDMWQLKLRKHERKNRL